MADTQDEAGEIVRELQEASPGSPPEYLAELCHRAAAFITTQRGVEATEEEREACAALCERMGDEEFAERANKQNIGIATMAQRHYVKCADAIRSRTLHPDTPEER